MSTNYDRMQNRRCSRFAVSDIHPAICTCGDYYWEHSHRHDTGRRWVLIRDDERERMRNRWYEEINTRRYQLRLQRRKLR